MHLRSLINLRTPYKGPYQNNRLSRHFREQNYNWTSSFKHWKGTHSIFSHTPNFFDATRSQQMFLYFTFSKKQLFFGLQNVTFFLNHSRIKIGSFTWLACHSVAKYFLLYLHYVTYTISSDLQGLLCLFCIIMFYSVAQKRWCQNSWNKFHRH